MSDCRWNGSDRPRVLIGRHDDECPGEGCRGCQPCTETHCVVCGKEHAMAACPECVASTRDDLDTIAALCNALPAESVHRGAQSEAAMLWGPTADPEAWRNRSASLTMGGRCSHYRRGILCPDDEPVPDGPACAKCKHPTCVWIRGDRYRCQDKLAWLEDCRDERHPLWVLGTWEQVWRDHLDQPTDLTATLPRLVDYLTRQMHLMALVNDPPFDEFARELRDCRSYMEDILYAGEPDEKGAPCVQCERPMVRVVTDKGAQDSYYCSRCKRTVSGDQYRYAVGVAYRANADRLTAADMAERFSEDHLKASVVRVWGARELIRKRGTNEQGITLYDVSDVEARIEENREAEISA